MEHLPLIPVEIVRICTLSLLKHRGTKWSKSDSEAILQVLKNPQLMWSKDDLLEAMGHISESSNDFLLLTFPSLLDHWFNSDFKYLKTSLLPVLCKTWYHHLIGIDACSTSESDFIFEIYKNLSFIFPVVGKHTKIFKELLDVADDRAKRYATDNILSAMPKVATLQKEICNPYGEMVKEILRKFICKVDNKAITTLLKICGCKNDVLYIQNG